MKRLLQPKYILPIVLSISIFAALLAFGNVDQVIAAMQNFKRIYLLWTLLLFAGYEIVRGWQWVFLLDRLGLGKKRRSQIFAFLIGEVAKSAPIGNYLQNYVLNVTAGEDIGTTSAATTLMVLAEVAVSLTGVVILGLGAWTFYLRVVIIGGVLVAVVVGWLVARHHSAFRVPQWVRNHKATRKIMGEVRNLGAALVDLLNWRTLAITYVNSLLYLILGGAALYLTARGLDVNISFGDALAVYFFSLAVTLIIPLPTDLGATELSGTGAFLLVGLTRTAAVSIEIIYRVISIGSSIVIGLVGCLVYRDQLALALKQHATIKASRSQRDGQPQRDGAHASDSRAGEQQRSPGQGTGETVPS